MVPIRLESENDTVPESESFVPGFLPSAKPSEDKIRTEFVMGASKIEPVVQHHIQEAPFDVIYGDVAHEWTEQPENARSLNIVLMGTPNAGHLVNQLVKDHITAVSNKRNTTRDEVLGVATKGNAQLVIYDTPGINEPAVARRELQILATAALDRAKTADLGIVIVDSVKKISPAEEHLFAKVKQLSEENPVIKLILVLNKVDLCNPKKRLLFLAERIWKLAPFDRCFMISAMSGDGVEDLEKYLMEQAVPREWEYSSKVSSNQSSLDRVEEIIREKIYRRFYREIPYKVEMKNIGWTDTAKGFLRIDEALLVTHAAQQRLLQKNLPALTVYAKRDIEQVLKKEVRLFLQVLVRAPAAR